MFRRANDQNPAPVGRARPRKWPLVVTAVGKTLVALGALLLAFTAYQVWGTQFEEARAQRGLENRFEAAQSALIERPTTTLPPPTDDDDPTPTSEVPPTTVPSAPTSLPPASTSGPPLEPPPEISIGDPIALLEIPSIDLTRFVVAGVDAEQLRGGPGHYPFTPLPGQLGNASIAGHRTTYGGPFRRLDRLEPGDEILITMTNHERFVYLVTDTEIVDPSDAHVLDTTDVTRASLTLTTCHPEFSARQRLIVRGELDRQRSPIPSAPTFTYARPPVIPQVNDAAAATTVTTTYPTATTTTTTAAAATPTTTSQSPPPPDDAGAGSANGALLGGSFSDGWWNDRAAWPHVILWGGMVAALALLTSLVGRRSGWRWTSRAVGTLPFLVVLYFFFQNLNRLLPPSL